MSDETSAAIATFRDAVAEFDNVAKQVADASWNAPTPCSEWNVRQLFNHVVAEDLWAPPLIAGRSVDDVAGKIPDDALGDDPLGAWASASSAALSAADDPGLASRTMRLTGREASPEQYLMEMATDHAVHAWDLSAALGQPVTLDVDLVERIRTWFQPQAEMWRSAGAIGPAVDVSANADAQTTWLAGFGRSSDWRAAD
jgi:uncharacterized protein (TIGR03086 family)